MRTIARLLLVAGLVMSLAACGTPGTDFWGNPIPSETPVPEFDATCAAPEADPSQAWYDPNWSHARPGSVRPGNSWIVVGIEVRALSPLGDAEWCAPIAVHVYNGSTEADALVIDGNGLQAGPRDFITTTPFVGRYMALQYDPTEERFAGRPPMYDFQIEATYLHERDVFGDQLGRPKALRCAITYEGATIVQNMALVSDGAQFVTCRFTGNDHWRIWH